MKLTKLEIEALNRAIVNINTLSSGCIDALSVDVEDVELFLEVLKTLQISKLKQVTLPNTKQEKITQLSAQYNEDGVRLIFSELTVEKIEETYSMGQLKAMYFGIYKKLPLSKSTKRDIVNTIHKRFHQLDRATAFLERHS